MFVLQLLLLDLCSLMLYTPTALLAIGCAKLITFLILSKFCKKTIRKMTHFFDFFPFFLFKSYFAAPQAAENASLRVG